MSLSRWISTIRSHHHLQFRVPYTTTKLSQFLSTSTQTKTSINSDKSPNKGNRWRRLEQLRKEAPPPKNRQPPSFDKKATHTLTDAIGHARLSSWAEFDESVELVIRLNIDPRQVNQNLRGHISLPHGTGRRHRVAAITDPGESADAALAAGADLVGEEDLIQTIAKDRAACLKKFSACITQPHLLPILASKVGRILGPKRLMPSPRDGTVDQDIAKCVQYIKTKWLPYRTDRFGNIHLIVGKLSFDDEKLIENIKHVVQVILDVKPTKVKKKYFSKAVLSSTMGPGVMLDLETLIKMATSP